MNDLVVHDSLPDTHPGVLEPRFAQSKAFQEWLETFERSMEAQR